MDQNLADQLLKRSFDAGVNFVDTADVYTNGESEKTLGQGHQERRHRAQRRGDRHQVSAARAPAGTMWAPRAATSWTP